MTRAGLLYDPTTPDDAVLTIDGHDLYADGWASVLDPLPAPGHQAGCRFARYGVPRDGCPTCRPL